MVELLLRVAGDKFFNQGDPVCETDVLLHLPSECPLADRLDALLERLKILLSVELRKLTLEAGEVTEGEIVNDAHQAVQLKQAILERGRGKQSLRIGRHSRLDRIADLIGRFVDVPQPV